MSFLSFLRKIKHYLWVNYIKNDVGTDKLRRFYSQKVPYTYDLERYTDHIDQVVVPNSSTSMVNHLFYDSQLPIKHHRQAPYQIFTLWLGDNDLTPARKKSFERIHAVNPDLKVILVTSRNLADYVLPEHPLHASYEKLSYIQRSDYLRAYLMHYHGGVYMDIKPLDTPWTPLLEELNHDPNLWIVAPHAETSWYVSPASGVLGQDQRRYYTSIVNMSAFACKPYSRFTDEWLTEVNRRMDYFSSLLEHRNESLAFGYMPEYPVPWVELAGRIISPLSLKYIDHIKTVGGMRFGTYPGGYRR